MCRCCPARAALQQPLDDVHRMPQSLIMARLIPNHNLLPPLDLFLTRPAAAAASMANLLFLLILWTMK